MEKSREAFERLIRHIIEHILPQLTMEADSLAKLLIKELPRLEILLVEAFEIMFSPRQLLRQLVIITAVQLLIMAGEAVVNMGNSLVVFLSKAEREQQEVMKELSQATSYQQWKKVAARLDYMRGYDKWRLQDESSLFDCNVLKKRINDTVEMVRQGDVFRLMFRLRGGLARDQYGMQHEGLFSRAISGTKMIVEKYHESVAYALDFICDSQIEDEEVPTDAKLAFFNETRHAYGRTALLLSGGAYLGFYHIGVVKALFLEGLLPRVVSGASAGSLVAAMVGTRSDEEIRTLFDSSKVSSLGLRRDYFMPKSEIQSTTGRQIQRLIPGFLKSYIDPFLGMIFDSKFINLDTEHFKQAVIQNVGESTFQEAFDQTGRIINITVAPINNYDPPRLLNYLTAPHVCVWSAACASCAVPGLFDSITLIIKEPNGVFRPENEWTRQAHLDSGVSKTGNYTDGSIESDLPMQQLSELFNVNHFVVSQVNAHSALISSMALKATVWSSSLYGTLVGFQRFLKAQCRDWLRNTVNLLTYRSNKPSWSAKRGLHQMLTQDYEGREVDITITPWTKHLSLFTAFRSIIKNPGDAEYLAVMAAGEAATWPFFSRIKAHCHVEMTLDKCVQRLRHLISIEEQEGEESESEHQNNGTEHILTNGLKDKNHKRGKERGEKNRESATYSSSINRKKGKIDRTPSFYTSRSILNLSGLSVADRNPNVRNERKVQRSEAVPPTLNRKASPKTSKKTLVTSQQTKKPTHKNPVNPTPHPVPAPDLGQDSELAATIHVVDACDEDERKPASEVGSLSTSGSSGMFGGGWGLEGVGGSQDFEIPDFPKIPKSNSKSSGESSGISSGSTPKSESGKKITSSKSQVSTGSVKVAVSTEKRKPFGSPASPRSKSPKSSTTATAANKRLENIFLTNSQKNIEKELEKIKEKEKEKEKDIEEIKVEVNDERELECMNPGLLMTQDSVYRTFEILPSSTESTEKKEKDGDNNLNSHQITTDSMSNLYGEASNNISDNKINGTMAVDGGDGGMSDMYKVRSDKMSVTYNKMNVPKSEKNKAENKNSIENNKVKSSSTDNSPRNRTNKNDSFVTNMLKRKSITENKNRTENKIEDMNKINVVHNTNTDVDSVTDSNLKMSDKWSDDDFAALSVSVRTDDIPLKGGSYIFQNEGETLDRSSFFDMEGEEDIGVGEGVGEENDENDDDDDDEDDDDDDEDGEEKDEMKLIPVPVVICKSTSMSNFYYRSRSNENSPGASGKSNSG